MIGAGFPRPNDAQKQNTETAPHLVAEQSAGIVSTDRQAGALYDLIPAVPQNAKDDGEWNHVKITVFKGTVIHWMNGENVVEYHLWTQEWKDMVGNSKFKDWPNFVDPASEGYIGLQGKHAGAPIFFRNIKIEQL